MGTRRDVFREKGFVWVVKDLAMQQSWMRHCQKKKPEESEGTVQWIVRTFFKITCRMYKGE